MFAVPGKLLVNKKRGICVAADEHAVQLHFSAEDSQVILVAGLPAVDQRWSRPDLSPSARLQHAARQAQCGEVKASWDPPELVRVAGSWANASVGAMRRVADEALSMGWPEVFDWVGLTSSEKSWRRAHHAATDGDFDGVRRHLVELPASGYPDRLGLCLRCIAHIVDQPEQWRPVVEAALAGSSDPERLAERDVVKSAMVDPPERAIRRFGAVLVKRGYGDRGRYWTDTADRLRDGVPGRPPDQQHPAWTALSLYLNRSEGFPAERVRLLSAVLLDELVEVGSLDPVTAFDHLGEADRTYLEARLRPGALDLDALERAEHVDELARRAFLTGDEASLDGLPAGDAVNHYQELLHVVAGEEVALQRLRPTARSAIAAAVEAQGLAAEGRRLVLPDEVVQDPSLWNLFIESARRGNIQLSDAQRRSGIRYADWVALQELAGLVADESMDRAVEVGRSLVKTTHDPAFRAEAASLTGAALRALDRSSEAYDLLETQLSGNYSQGLWLNAAILAEAAKPDAARHYWTHLAKEMVAPLSWAALLRAVEAPGASGIDQWSSDLIALASEALAVCDVDTYARLLSKARGGAPKLVTELSKRGGEFDHPRSLYLLLVKAYSARPVRSDELVGCFTSVSEERRSDAWFVRELQHLADGLIAMLLDSLADAATAAEIAAALSQGQLRAWLRPEQVYLLSCLGFGQQAGHNATTKSWRPQHEYEQRVFVPLSEFRSIHAPEAPPWMELTYEGFSRAIFASIKGRLTVVTRDGAKLERITRDELHEGSLPRLQVEAERLTDRQDLKPHLDLAQACIRNMKTLTPQDSTLNSMRISELEGLVRELERVIDDYKAWP